MPPRTPPRPPVPLPARFKFEDDGTRTRIAWRWFSPAVVVLVLFCLYWNGVAIAAYLYSPTLFWEDPLLRLIQVGLGAWLAYQTLVFLLNRTSIEVSRERLAIRHGPLPWKRNVTLTPSELQQLYVVEVRRGSRNSPTYSLYALDRNDRQVELLSKVLKKEHVLYLEQALERRLGIEDRPVEGEVAVPARSA